MQRLQDFLTNRAAHQKPATGSGGTEESILNSKKSDDRRKLLEAVQTPLGFFSLTLLVAEALFTALALNLPTAERTTLLYVIAGTFALLVLVIAGIATLRPEALWGKRYSSLDDAFARGLGEEIYTALDSYLSGLKEETARQAVYELLRRTIATSPHARSRATKRFCNLLVQTIIRRANLNGRWEKAKRE